MLQVLKSASVYARDLYRIRPLLNLKTSFLLSNALVSSRLDYCYSLLVPLTDFELRRLQQVQNSLCRFVTHSSKFSHITQLKKLHWLPDRYRVHLKIGPITFCKHSQLAYLSELIHPCSSCRNKRCSSPKLKFLHIPTSSLRLFKFFQSLCPCSLELLPHANKKQSLCHIQVSFPLVTPITPDF